MLVTDHDISQPPDKSFQKFAKNSLKERSKGNISGGYDAGANHAPPAHKGKKRVRMR